MERFANLKGKIIRTEKLPAGKYSHARILHVRERHIHDYTCDEKTCRFYGKESRQGVCHTTPAEIRDTRRMDRAFADAKEFAQWAMGRRGVKKNARTRKEMEAVIVNLSAELQVMFTNYMWTLDELVKHRGEIAILRDEAEKRKRRKAKS